MNSKSLATPLLLLGTLFWGMTFVFIKEGTSFLNLYNFLSYRFLLAGAILSLLFVRRLSLLNWRILKYGLLLSIPLALTYITQTIGLQYTTASKGGFITGLSVVFVPFILGAMEHRFPRFRHLIAVVFATLGLALLTLSDSLSLNQGDIWVFVCAVAFAGYIILVGRYAQKFDAILLTIVQLFSVGIICAIASLFDSSFSFPQEYVVWQAIVFTAVFATAFMFVIQNYFQKFVSEVKVAIIFSFEPLFAAIMAFLYLHENITFKIILGGLLIFLGIIVAEIDLKMLLRMITKKS